MTSNIYQYIEMISAEQHAELNLTHVDDSWLIDLHGVEAMEKARGRLNCLRRLQSNDQEVRDRLD